VLPLLGTAQQPAQVRRIAFLGLNFPPAASQPTPFFDAFRHELRERGWVEGYNLTIERRWAEGNLERFAALVTEVIGLQVEVMVVPNGNTASIAHQITTTLPIVVVGGGLIGSELIASPARPGGNVTGISFFDQDILTKRLELLKQVLPGVTRVAMLRGLSWQTLPALEEVTRSLDIALHLFEVREPVAFDDAFATMTRAQLQALLVLSDPFFEPYRQRIADLALQHHLPSICDGRPFAVAGCLMTYNGIVPDHGQRIAAYVDKILRGAKPAELPVEQPMQFRLVLNLKTAQALDLTIPSIILFQADEVIK
jgi:putative ABC transport system substrate-binding protein